jgi:hypothetical protein
MSFDVQTQLPLRASKLREAQRAALREAMDGSDAGAGDREHPSDAYGKPAPDFDVDRDEIMDIYNDFLDIPAPEDFSTVTDDLGVAMQMLTTEGMSSAKGLQFANKNLNEVQTVATKLEDWSGQAAQNFHRNYGANFEDTASNQYETYYLLRHAINAEAAVWQTVRDDLDKLSKEAIEQMQHVNDSNQDDWKAVLSVAGAVIAIGAAVPTAGTSVGAWSVAAAGVAVLGAHQTLTEEDKDKGKKDKLDLANSSPRQVIDEVNRALNEIKKRITSAEDEIRDKVRSAVQIVDKHGTGWKEICLPRPTLAEVGRGDLNDREGTGTV